MTEEQKQALIEKCKNEISRYSHLVKTFDPNEGEEMEEYQQNIQDWNDIISVNTLALVSLTAPAADLAKLVPDEMSEFPGKEIIDRHFNWTDKDDAEVFAVGFNACRAAILRNIEEAK